MNKISMIGLGCPKNQVDAEMLLAALVNAGFDIQPEVEGSDIVIINTCAFGPVPVMLWLFNKLKAKKGSRRIPERRLFLLALLGGAAGGIAAAADADRLSR